MKKCYILDTNILIENTDAISIFRNGEENKVLIPYAVITELDRLKQRPDLSHIISNLAHKLETELNKTYQVIKIDKLIYSNLSYDNEILRDIQYSFKYPDKYFEGLDPIVITNDILFRCRLKMENIPCQEFESSKPYKSESQSYTGIIKDNEPMIPNSFQWINGQLWSNEKEIFITYENNPWKIEPKSVYQNCAMDLMLSKNIDLITLQSQAGHGKTFCSLACALDLVLEKKLFSKIFIFKPIVHIAEKIGYLPGTYEEKLAPHVRNVTDLLIKLHRIRPANKLFIDPEKDNYSLNPKKIEVLDLNLIRGFNIDDAIVIVDEAQNLTRYQTRALLTRLGENVKCFVLGDTSQVDHPYLNAYNNGLNWVVVKCKGKKNYGHLVLKGNKSRGPITDLILSVDL